MLPHPTCLEVELLRLRIVRFSRVLPHLLTPRGCSLCSVTDCHSRCRVPLGYRLKLDLTEATSFLSCFPCSVMLLHSLSPQSSPSTYHMILFYTPHLETQPKNMEKYNLHINILETFTYYWCVRKIVQLFIGYNCSNLYFFNSDILFLSKYPAEIIMQNWKKYIYIHKWLL